MIFKQNINKTRRMQTILVLCIGVFLTGLGLYLGLKNFDPKYFNVIAGAIIAFLTLFGLFGKLLQDISSSLLILFITLVYYIFCSIGCDPLLQDISSDSTAPVEVKSKRR